MQGTATEESGVRKVRRVVAEELERLRTFAAPEPAPDPEPDKSQRAPRSVVALVSVILTATTLGGTMVWNASGTKESILARVQDNGRRAEENGKLLEKIAEQIDSVRLEVQSQGKQLFGMNGELGRLKDDLKKLDGAAVELERLKKDLDRLDDKTGDITYYKAQYEQFKRDVFTLTGRITALEARVIALEKRNE